MEKVKLIRNSKVIFKRILLLIALLFGYNNVWSQTAQDAAAPTNDYSLAYILVTVVVMFVFIIAFLSKLLENVSDYYVEKWKSDRRKESEMSKKSMIVILFLLSTVSSMAQGSTPSGSGIIGGIPSLLFYILVSIIILEFTVVMVLTWQIWRFLQVKMSHEPVTEAEIMEAKIIAENKLNWWDRFNSFKPLSKETDLDMGHEYDGIRELDNKLPPWWLYGFYITILAGVIYLYRFHIAHTGMSSEQEYITSVEAANKSKDAFLKKSGSSVDENTVVLITDPTQLSAGEANFATLCSVCHGKKGEGLVGPNLTDDYWIYGGGVKDIFKTIKYGTNKGMQSWKENLSAEKIAQLTSYLKTLKGTNPPNAKAPDGTLYQETAEASPKADSSAVK